MKRIKLSERVLPDYTLGEELFNAISHGAGVVLGILVCLLCAYKSQGNLLPFIGSLIYGCSMIALYAISMLYHSFKPGMTKKVFQILDHCTIYFLIAGTYTPIVLTALRPVYPALGWGLFFFEWALTALAVTLTAIDLKKYNVFSMICYIGMGWAIIPFLSQTMNVLTRPGFYYLLSGGIAYTIGAILYGIGSKKRWFHSVFHIFVVLGSLLQRIAVAFYAL